MSWLDRAVECGDHSQANAGDIHRRESAVHHGHRQPARATAMTNGGICTLGRCLAARVSPRTPCAITPVSRFHSSREREATATGGRWVDLEAYLIGAASR